MIPILVISRGYHQLPRYREISVHKFCLGKKLLIRRIRAQKTGLTGDLQTMNILGVYRACNALHLTSISYTSLMHFEAGFCPRHSEVNGFLCINVRVICCTVCIYHSMYIPYKEF